MRFLILILLISCGKKSNNDLSKDNSTPKTNKPPESVVTTDTKPENTQTELVQVKDKEGNVVRFDPKSLFFRENARPDQCWFRVKTDQGIKDYEMTALQPTEEVILSCGNQDRHGCNSQSIDISFYSLPGTLCDVRLRIKGFIFNTNIFLSSEKNQQGNKELLIDNCAITHECFYFKGVTVTRAELNTYRFTIEPKMKKKIRFSLLKHIPDLLENDRLDRYRKYYNEVLMNPFRQ